MVSLSLLDVVLQTDMGFGARCHHIGAIEGAAQSKAACTVGDGPDHRRSLLSTLLVHFHV
jgi:hypothetical protein